MLLEAYDRSLWIDVKNAAQHFDHPDINRCTSTGLSVEEADGCCITALENVEYSYIHGLGTNLLLGSVCVFPAADPNTERWILSCIYDGSSIDAKNADQPGSDRYCNTRHNMKKAARCPFAVSRQCRLLVHPCHTVLANLLLSSTYLHLPYLEYSRRSEISAAPLTCGSQLSSLSKRGRKTEGIHDYISNKFMAHPRRSERDMYFIIMMIAAQFDV